MRRPVTDIALLAYIAKKDAKVVSYTEATKACKSSSSASRALHQLINEGILEPKPKLIGLRYVTQYVVTQRGKQVAALALQLTQLREAAAKMNSSQERLGIDDDELETPGKSLYSAAGQAKERKKNDKNNGRNPWPAGKQRKKLSEEKKLATTTTPKKLSLLDGVESRPTSRPRVST